MSKRGPSDRFTRFTSTTPSFAASSSSSPSSPSFTQSSPPQNRPPPPPFKGSAAPPNETAAERVARLRAANRLAKERAAFTPLDRVIARGRNVADAAHRLTTYSLLAFTGVASVVAAYGLVSLVTHNRRQKRAWIDRELGRLKDAQDAFLRGEANAEQLHLLEQERAGEEMAKKFEKDQAKKKQDGVFSSIKALFTQQIGSGVKGAEEATAGRQAGAEHALQDSDARWRPESSTKVVGDMEIETRPAAIAESGIAGVGFDSKGRPVPANKVERVIRKVEDERRIGEREVTSRTGMTGGQLDLLAGNVADATKSQGQSWWNWATGSKS